MLKYILTLCSLISFSSFSTELTGDDEYLQNEISHQLKIFYSSPDLDAAESLHSSVPGIIKYYEKTFGYKMDEQLNVILASSKNHQVMNGYSTQHPFNMTMYFGGGALDVDYFSALSWVDLLSAHEIAHDFQLNSKNNWVSRSTHAIFGNTILVFPFIPLISFPNSFLPQFILEGNAILNESLYNNGGRLFNGAQRATTFTYLKAGKFTPANMINRQTEFPFGDKPYIIGAYFHAYLAETYGVPKVNSFFEHNSTKAFGILALNDSYEQTFGVGYEQLFQDFLERYKSHFTHMQFLKGELITTDYYKGSMTKSGEQILFKVQALAGERQIYQFDTHSLTIKKHQAGQWPAGKPFLYNDKLYTSSSVKTAYNNISIGLFNNNRHALKNFKGKALQAVNGKDLLYFDVQSSYGEPKLHFNNDFYSIAHSSAILDSSSNIYYFKNSGKTRTLYKNHDPIYSYQGFWGFPIEVLDNAIYFIAPTKHGSSLYVWKRGKVQRLSTADNIIDAKMITSEQFIAKSVTSESYEYRIAKITSFVAPPFEYKYNFENHSPTKLLGHKQLEKSSKEYNSLLGLKYSGLYTVMSYSSAQVKGAKDPYLFSSSLLFADPLKHNQLSIGYMQTEELKLAMASYQNSRYRLQYFFNAMYVIDDLRYPNFLHVDSSSGTGGSFLLNLPLIISGLHSWDLSLSGYVDYDDIHKNPFVLSLDYQYQENYGRALNPLKYLNSTLYFKYDKNSYADDRNNGDLTMFGGKIVLGRGFSNEFYMQFKTQYTKASSGNTIKVDDQATRLTEPTDFHLSSLYFFHTANEVYSGSVKFAKTFYADWYHHWIPFSIRRETLFLEAESMELRYDGGSDFIIAYPGQGFTRSKHIVEMRIGIDYELLIFHNAVVNSRLQYTLNSHNGGVDSVEFGINTSF